MIDILWQILILNNLLIWQDKSISQYYNMSSLTKYFSSAWNQPQFSPFRFQEEQTVAPWENSHPNLMKQIYKKQKGLAQNQEQFWPTPEKYRSLNTISGHQPKTTPRCSIRTHHSSSTLQKKSTCIYTERKKAASCIKMPLFLTKRAVKTPLKKENPQKKLARNPDVKFTIEKSKKYPRFINQTPSLFQINNIRDLLLQRKKELIMSRVLKSK